MFLYYLPHGGITHTAEVSKPLAVNNERYENS
jgi:hypothetical protein